MLVLSMAVLQIGRIYQKGTVNAKTQEVARTVIEDVSRSIQFSGGEIQTLDSGSYCIGNRRYSVARNQQVKTSPARHALLVDEPSGNCSASGAQSLTAPTCSPAPLHFCGEELVGVNMRLSVFTIEHIGESRLYKVRVRVVYGDDDLLCSPSAGDCSSSATSVNLGNPDISCKSQRAGTQFCAVSDLSTTVQKRVE
jgi:hypothetical protein